MLFNSHSKRSGWKDNIVKRALIVYLFLSFLTVPLLSGTIGLSIYDTTVTRGSAVYLPIRVDSSLTGLHITSYELHIQYYSTVFSIDSVLASGTLTASWGNPTVNSSSGALVIAGAGATSLSGTGVLVYLKITFPPQTSGGYNNLQFMSAILNEGVPQVVTRNGNINISEPPRIYIYPNDAVLTMKEHQQFNAYGATPPYRWSTTDTSIATIDSTGLLTSKKTGACRVIAKDVNAIVDSTSIIEVRAFRLSLRDTTFLQGQTFLMPVYISDLSATNIYSGSFTITFNPDVLHAAGVVYGVTLLSQAMSFVHADAGSITISFASSSRLNGVGTQIMVYLQFDVLSTSTYSTSLQFSPVTFNETMMGITTNAYFSPTLLSSLTVTSAQQTLVKGDSLQFYAYGTIVPPLMWSVMDTSLAGISSSGMLRAKKGGTVRVNVVDSVGARGQSTPISLYDASLQLPSQSVMRSDTVEFPITINGTLSNLYSIQLTLNYPQAYVIPIGATTTGTLLASGGWFVSGFSPTDGVFNIAAAGSSPISGTGILIKVRAVLLQTMSQGDYQISVGNILCNEGSPYVLGSSAWLHVDTAYVVQMSVTQNWNMVSVPLRMNDYLKTTLFPHAQSGAYIYQNGYRQRDTLAFGVGYWIRFQSSDTWQLAGTPVTVDTITVVDGWNMIGALTSPVSVSNIIPIGTSAPSVVYGFTVGTGYTGKTTLQPGHAYWVRVYGAGKLVLRSGTE